MKLSRKSIFGFGVAAIVAAGAYVYWNVTRFREATYTCADGSKEIVLTSSTDIPYSGEFRLSGFVTRGELTITGFPTRGAPPGGPMVSHFKADGGGIAETWRGEWYDAPVPVHFEPSDPQADCRIKMVYRIRASITSSSPFAASAPGRISLALNSP